MTRLLCCVTLVAGLTGCLDADPADRECEGTSCSDSVAALSAPPDVSSVGVAPVKQWAMDRVSWAASDFATSGNQRLSSPGFWGVEIVYQIQVDRFNDGDTSNDGANLPPGQATNQGTSAPWGLPSYRQGGDLRGVMQRLDYIKDLGATTLWLTPVLKHNGDYHGYCTTDPTTVDPGFGSSQELRDLVTQAHARGIKVILDIVVNHMCDRATHYSRAPNHGSCASDLNANYWSGAPGGSSNQGTLAFSNDFFGPLKSQAFFNRCGANTQSEMAGIDPPAVFGDFTDGMLDFDTRNYDFQEIFTNLYKYWIAYADLDGFRLDAAKHVSLDFTAYFSSQVRAYARSLGKTNFLVVAEVAAPSDWVGRSVGTMFSNPSNPDQHGSVPQALTSRMWSIKNTYLSNSVAPYPGANAVFDFMLSGTERDTLLNNRSAHSVEDYFASSALRTLAGQGDTRLNWNVLEIHDWPRFAQTQKANPWKSALGLMLLPMMEGTTVLYYGMEQGFNGDCHFNNMNAGAATSSIQGVCSSGSDATYRQNMFIGSGWRLGSTVPAINNLAYVGTANHSTWQDWTTDPYLDRSHFVFQASRKANAIRLSCNALRYGRTYFRWGDFSNAGLFAFSRIDGNEEVVVVVNTDSVSHGIPNLTIDGGINTVAGQKYVNLMNGAQVGWTMRSGTGSSLTFNGLQIDGNAVMTFVHQANVAPYNAYLGTLQCKDFPR